MARFFQTPRGGLWLIMGAATLWGTTGVVTQALYRLSATNALSVAFLRLAVAALVLLLFCWRMLGRRLWQVKRRDALLMLGMGAMQATSQYAYFAAIAQCGVTIATLVTICLAPVLVALLAALLLRERLTRGMLVALVCAVGGTALLTGAPAGGERFNNLLLGVLLSLLSAVTYALVILIGRALSGRYHSLQVNAVSFGSGALLLLACSLTMPLVLRYPVAGWLLVLYLGGIPTALAYVAFQIGMRSTPATLTSILTFCEPLTAAVLAWVFFGERLSALGMVGALLLLGTIGLLALAAPTPGATH
jgi:DME family drug/metabolite transporter